jgi:Mn-dependent DtxR family transcriptional regulator
VKEEDTDWLVYHQLPDGAPVTMDTLASRCGLGLPEVEASLNRLERSCLVERTGSSVRMLTFGEALIKNQVKYEEDLPFTIENGVIREKKKTSCQDQK